MKRSATQEIPHVAKKASTGRLLESGEIYFNKVAIIPDEFNEKAFSLKELLEIMRPVASLHFNFMIDTSWLLKQYPVICRRNKAPITLVVGEKQGTPVDEVVKDTQHNPEVKVLAARLPIPFGTHHTKLSILESGSEVHVIISTANLLASDWEAKTQCFYYASGKIKEEKVTSTFAASLVEYMELYKLDGLTYWMERLAYCDFSHVQDKLIFSVPGYHRGDMTNKVGHRLLKSYLKELGKPVEEPSSSPLYVFQCSSIGSLGSQPTSWLHSEFFGSVSPSGANNARMFLIYPCVEDVRGSIEGYEAGCSLPYQSSTNTKQPWLRSMMCKWRSEGNGRSRAMPHVKTYAKFINGQPQWMVLTSANLSKAAWGEAQKNGSQVCIRSFELGVLIKDKTRIRLPYDYPILRYSKTDEPWLVDKCYTQPDSHEMSKEGMLLSYGDTNIHMQDLMILRNNEWLNDRILSFAAEYITEQMDEKTRKVTEIISPPIVEMIKMADDAEIVVMLLEQLNLHEKEIVLFMLNDNTNPSLANGGSHWTLLVYLKKVDKFIHYDSNHGCTQSKYFAEMVASNVEKAVGSVNWTIEAGSCPKQPNQRDCGIFVIEFVDNIVQNRGTFGVSKLNGGKVSSRRKYWADLIEKLSKKKKK